MAAIRGRGNRGTELRMMALLRRLDRRVGKSDSLRQWGGDTFRAMNWHEVIDERSIELHGVIARELRADPAKLDLVVAWIQRFLDDPERGEDSKDALREWLGIIRQGLPAVLGAIADRSEEGQRLRQSTPFAVLMPQDERARIFAKYEALRTRTHPAGV